MSSPSTLGTRLRRAREDAKIEQRAAAKVAGVHEVTLSNYENDKRPAPAVVRQKLATLYGLPRDAFDGAEPAPPSTPPPEVPTVAIPLHQLTYWRGVLETEYRHLGGLSRSMEAMLSMLNDATQGIGGFIDSGVLPRPIPTLPLERMESTTDDEARRRTG